MEEIPDVSPEQRAASELVKILRKLRWMGMEGEAEWMEEARNLGRRRAESSMILIRLARRTFSLNIRACDAVAGS